MQVIERVESYQSCNNSEVAFMNIDFLFLSDDELTDPDLDQENK